MYNKREIGRRMFTNKRFSISDILREEIGEYNI
jgi:hypothetical protein